MGLEEIIDEIESETSKKISDMRQKSKAEESEIIGSAKAEAKRISDEARDKAADEVRSILSRELSKVEMEAKGIFNRSINESLEDAIEQIRESFADYRKGGEYALLMDKLVALAVKNLGSDCRIVVNKADQKLVSAKGKVKTETDDARVPDGIIAYSADGKRFVDYTLRSVLENSKDVIAAELLKRIRVPDKPERKAKTKESRKD